ncbi:MAG: cytidine deaminase [Candidatus Hepatoplasma vulgare]|nr:MAG: cytidine deaminase [Candidatus Hepatoplasma sp.]
MYEIKKELILLLNNTYSIYSDYQCASIVIDKNKNKYKGVNVENVSFGATSCAERNAIFNAVANGMKMGDLEEVHIMSNYKKTNNKDYFAFPCGICRQVISEASTDNAKIFIYNQNGLVKKYNIKKLLPNSFKEDI